MTNNSNKKKSKTNLSTKNIVSNKSSSPSTTPKSATTTSKLTATPKSLNSETPAQPPSSASTILMSYIHAIVNIQDEKMQSLTKRVLCLESTLRETQSRNLIAMKTSNLLEI